MSENSFSSLDFGSNSKNQFDVFKLSGKGFTIEQINKIFELDNYFASQGIGKKGELVSYLAQTDNVLYHNSLVRNIDVVLKYKDNPIYNRVAERLRCSSVEDYYKFILSVRDLESFCDTYTSSPHNVKSFKNYKRNESGYVNLEPKDYLITNIPASQGTREGKWYLLSNRTRVFIKNVCSMREAYSELISEEIAKQMGIPAASYDLVEMGGLLKIASINILDTGEELIHGFDILNDLKIKDINTICSQIGIKIKNSFPTVDETKTQTIKEDFLKLTIFDKIIRNWDRNPGNWGLVVSPDKKDVKLAPEFDNNKALEYNKFDYRKDMTINGEHSIESLLDYCLKNFSNPEEFLSFIEDSVKNVNVKNACKNILDKKGISIPQKEMLEIEMIVHGMSIQQMRFWVEGKRKNKELKDKDKQNDYSK